MVIDGTLQEGAYGVAALALIVEFIRSSPIYS